MQCDCCTEENEVWRMLRWFQTLVMIKKTKFLLDIVKHLKQKYKLQQVRVVLGFFPFAVPLLGCHGVNPLILHTV